MSSFVRLPFSLDEEPLKRWTSIFQHPSMSLAISKLKVFLTQLDIQLKRYKVYFLIPLLAKRYRARLTEKYPDYLQEILGICHLLNCSCDTLIILQFIYEFGATCTSVIFENYSGEVLHFRTLDWQMPVLRECTLVIDVFKGHQWQYSNITFLGYVGLYTGMKPGQFSLSLNYRPLHDDHRHRTSLLILFILKNLIRPFHDYELNGFALRQAMEQCATYSEIVNRLKSIRLAASCYLMICGNSEGIRLIRDWKPSSFYTFSPWHSFKQGPLTSMPKNLYPSLHTYSYPAEEKLQSDTKTPYLIQTNMDPARYEFLRQYPELKIQGILYSFSRCQQAEKLLTKYRQKEILFAQLIEQLCRFPIINKKTIFWCLMYPKKGELVGATISK